MPQLTKKLLTKSKFSSSFKSPALTKQNIEKMLKSKDEPDLKKVKIGKDEAISQKNPKDSQYGKKTTKSVISMDYSSASSISNRLNEPHIKAAFLKFRESLKSTPSSASQTQQNSNPNQSAFELDQSASIKDQSNSFDKSTDLFKDDQMNDSDDLFKDGQMNDSGVHLSQEVLNSQVVKEKYLKFCRENYAEDLQRISQELQDSEFAKKIKPKKAKADKKLNKENIPGYNIKENKVKSGKVTKEKLTKASLKKTPKKDAAEKIIKKTDTKTKNKKHPIERKKNHEENESGEELPISLFEKMVLIHESRNVGLYAYCDSCDKARYLADIKDPLDLPDKWYCSMNPDPEHNKCSDPEEVEEDEDYLIHNLYNAGSIVWARLDGYPWWPAMVEDDPDTEDYYWVEDESMKPTMYHVTFFDLAQVTRAWMLPSQLKPFKINMKNPEFRVKKFDIYKKRIDVAYEQASDAILLPLLERLKKYSFIYRYKNPQKLMKIKSKRSVNKKCTKEDGKKRKPEDKIAVEDNLAAENENLGNKIPKMDKSIEKDKKTSEGNDVNKGANDEIDTIDKKIDEEIKERETESVLTPKKNRLLRNISSESTIFLKNKESKTRWLRNPIDSSEGTLTGSEDEESKKYEEPILAVKNKFKRVRKIKSSQELDDFASDAFLEEDLSIENLFR